MKTDKKARYQGYSFFFKEGFCWSDINTTFLKCRIKGKSVNDVKSMSLYGVGNYIPEYYFVSLINSSLISYYVDSFVNNTQTFQINDARQLPIIIPSDAVLAQIKNVFDAAISTKKGFFKDKITAEKADEILDLLQQELDNLVYKLYHI